MIKQPNILKPRNLYKYFERPLSHPFGPNVVIYKTSCKYFRFMYRPILSERGVFTSCLVIDNFNTILEVYTHPEHRRQHLAKQLLAVAKVYLGGVKHSDNLTKEGELWRDSVEGIKRNKIEVKEVAKAFR